MKYIITEEQYDRLSIRRRLPQFMDFISKMPPYKKPCESVRSRVHYLALLEEWFFETFDLNMDIQFGEDKEYVWDYIMEFYGDKIINNFHKKCKK